VNPPPPPLRPEPSVWRCRYERLREQVLACDAVGVSDARGLALLIRQGLTGWMRGWQELPGSGAVAAPAPEAPPLPLTSASWHQEAARLLANMALSQLKPSSCAPPL
jgi:hypothetical protein